MAPPPRELALAAALAWAVGGEYLLPPSQRLPAVAAAAAAAAAPAVAFASAAAAAAAAALPLPALPYAAAVAALVVAALLYLLLSGEPPVVRVPELAVGPLPSRRVTDTSLSLPSRPGVIQCYSPSTLQFLGEVPVTTPEGVAAAVARARALQPRWAATSFDERRRVLRLMASAILAAEDDIVRVSAVDTGKPRVDAQFGEVLSTLGKLAWLCESGEAALAPQPRATNLTSAHKTASVVYQPLGVIGAYMRAACAWAARG
jgi:hypothetical protein